MVTIATNQNTSIVATDNIRTLFFQTKKAHKSKIKTVNFGNIKGITTMGAVGLKADIYELLNRIENEELLRTLYDFLKQRENSSEGDIWKSLTDQQKEEVYLSYEESEDSNNLINWNDVKSK